MAYSVSPAKYRRCVCGQVCKGGSALASHGRKCPVERARRAAYVAAIEAGRTPPTDQEFLATYARQI